MGPFQPGVSFGLVMPVLHVGHIWPDATFDALTARDLDGNISPNPTLGLLKVCRTIRHVGASPKLSAY